MRQFDVFANPSQTSRTFAPFVVVLQSHHLDPLETVVVAPMVLDAAPEVAGLDLPVEFDDRTLWIAIAELGPVERRTLRSAEGSLADHEYEIRRALDRVFTGF